MIAATDPATLPTAAARMAWFLNAYNALAMYGVVTDGIPKYLNKLDRLRFFRLRSFIINGRPMSLSALETDIIRPLGDPRVHFALNCMTVSCPRLPRTPFTADALDRRLDGASREFINDARHVRATTPVALSAIFDFYTTDFLMKAPSLIAYVNHYRAQPIPLTDRFVFSEYDWTINDQSRLTR